MRRGDRALRLVDCELEVRGKKAFDARHHSLARSLTAHIDVAVVSIAHEAVTTLLQFPVQYIKHQIRQQRRPRLLRLQICWQGGATEVLEVRQRPKRQDAIRYPDTFVAKIRDMAKIYNNREIVELLNGEGLTSSTGKPFTLEMISWIRYKHRIPAPLPPAGTLTVGQVRQRYGVSLWVVHYWIERGIVSAVHRKRNTPYAITINVDVDRRLREWVANSGHLRRVTPNAN